MAVKKDAVAVRSANELAPTSGFTNEQVSLIKSMIARDASDDELKFFLYTAQKRGLDPLAKQLYFQKRKNNKSGKYDLTFITSIDGYRLIADRTAKYAGSDDPIFDDETSPSKATVTVWKIVQGIRCPFTATARWDQYYPGDSQGFMWRKMPHLMLGKCAEALALRKAFPEELSGVYIKEEMEQAGPTVDHRDESETVYATVATPPDEVVAQRNTVAPQKRTASIYEGTSDQQKIISDILRKQGVPEEFWDDIDQRMLGRPSTDLKTVIEEVRMGF